MQKLVFRNANGIELDLTTDPFGITEWEGFSADELNIQSQQVPFQDGGVFLDALLNQRELSVTVAMNDKNNLETRYRLRREMISALNPKLGEGVLIYTNDFLSKQIHCIPQMPVFQNKNSNDSGTPKVSCSFTACNPYWEDVEDTVVRIQNHEIAEIENEGDIATQLLININTQNVTNPYIANLTTKKQIKLNFTSKTNIVINTRTGQKGVYTEKDVFEFLNGFVPVDILEDGEKILMAGKGLVLLDMFGSISASIGNYKRVKKLSDGKYYAFGVGTSYVFSEDGIKWEGRNVPGAVGNNVEDLELLGNRYIATVEGERGSICSWNIDGSNPWGYGGIQGITSFGSIFIKGDTAYTGHGATTDGINYTEYTGTGSLPERYKYQNLGNGNYIGITGNLIVKSSNAKDWTTAYTSADGNFEFVAKQSGKYFALINIGNATGKVLKSNTSSSWSSMGTLDFVPKSASLLNAKYTVYGEIYVAECYEGEEWNIADKQTTNFYGSIYKNEKYILVGYDSVLQKGVIKTTRDFNSFSLCFEADETINSIDFVKGLYVAGAGDGKIFTSSDLITWNEIQTSASGNITQIIFNEARNEYACVCESDILIGETLENLTLKTNVITSTSPTISYKDNLYYCFKLNASSELGLYATEDFNNFNLVYASIEYTKGFLGKYNDEIFFILSPILFEISDYSYLWFLKNGVPQYAGYSIIEINAYYEKDNKLYLAGTNGYTVYENEAGFKDNRLSLNCYSIVKGNELYVTGENTLILKITQQTTDENHINTLTTESDINLNLPTGTSRIEVGYDSGNAEFVVSYRQKYIGV